MITKTIFMMVPSYLSFTLVAVCLLLTNDNGVVAFSSSKLSSSSSTSSSSFSFSLSMMTLETHEIVGCFGRLADKAFVLPPTEVEGTSASGYEFGVLESGRPKWLCTYTERSGQTQGGGAELCHVPTWCSVLFPAEAAGLTKSGLNSILQDETTKFEMPLGASPMAKKKASDPNFCSPALTEGSSPVVFSALWKVLGGGTAGGSESLTMDTVSSSLQQAATEFGSQGDSMTYGAFEKAMKGQLPQPVEV